MKMSVLRVNFDELDVDGGNTYNGVPFTGIVYKLYENGNLMWEGNYKDGEEVGWWKNYYESGSLESEGNKVLFDTFTEKDGLWKEYYKTGQLKGEGNYECERSGKQGLWKEYYENGQLHKEQMYDVWGEKERINKQYDKTGNVVEPEYELIISGIDNMSGYGNCDIKLSLNESQWEEYVGDDYYTSTPGGIIELLQEVSKEEFIMVIRYQVFDEEHKIYYEIIEVETINSPNPSCDIYYKKGNVNYPNPVKYNEMTEKEVKEFNNSWEYNGDNRYYGVDVYTIENFDLELELKTGY